MIFIDANVLVAYYNIRDALHEKAIALMQRILANEYGTAVISDYIFNEALTVTQLRAKDRSKVVALGSLLLSSRIRIVKINSVLFQEAWSLFQKNNMSFTDCTNLAVLSMFSASSIATFDEEFKRIPRITVVQ